MTEHNANERATLSGKATSILNKRTLENAHHRLATLVHDGMTVLDVGCGTGAITKDIAERVGPTGRVVGIDNNEQLINEARETYASISNVQFHIGNIYETLYDNTFDIVTSARVLQWLAEPEKALQVMWKAVKPGGTIIVLDYNHEKIKWNPAPPQEMQYFYKQFLKWRADAGMDNTIVDRLEQLFKKIGLEKIKTTPQHETVQQNNVDGLQLWANVVASRGLQMVDDGYITETERTLAASTFHQWIKQDAISQTMYLLAVEGRK